MGTQTVAWLVFMAKLQSHELVAEGTMTFCLQKPADWTFDAAQFIDMTFIDLPETDAEGNTCGFSIAECSLREADHDRNPCA